MYYELFKTSFSLLTQIQLKKERPAFRRKPEEAVQNGSIEQRDSPIGK